VDIDLSLSPITNALPLNRLDIARTGTREIVAAWVRFPQLTVEPAPQRYETIAPSLFRYSSLASGFTATLRVDDLSFPIDYQGIWKRIGTGRPIPGARPAQVSKSVAHDGFVGALLADGPSAELGEAASVFGFLIGGWNASIRDIDPNGTIRTGRGEWWFSWVLEGRALQDVWIAPPRKERGQPESSFAANDRYGTTVRRFDRRGNEWKIVWINPVNGAENHLRGGRDSDGITLFGEDSGRPIRWRFVEIRPNAFTWQGTAKTMMGGSGPWRRNSNSRGSFSPRVRSDPLFVQCRRPGVHSTHPRERATHSLNVRDDGRDRAAATPGTRSRAPCTQLRPCG
jgi:hypothetical protein